MRLFYLVCFISTHICVCAQSQNSISFIWTDDVLNGEYFEKTAMHIPVSIQGDSTKYYFQFDTGANQSYIYTGKSKAYNLIEKFASDSIKTNIGKLKLKPRITNIPYRDNGKFFVGTIGADILKNKIIEIDFVSQKINFLDSYDEQDYYIETSKTTKGRPTMTLNIDNKDYKFLFDTGSSLFDLLTTKKLWKRWKKSQGKIDEFPISSWGKINLSSRTSFESPLLIYDKIEIEELWYNSSKRFNRLFRQSKVSGVVGNKPFFDDIVLMDVRNNRVGIKR